MVSHRITRHILSNALLAAAFLAFWSGKAAVAERVDVVVGPLASGLERFAAEELSEQFRTLFGVDVTVGSELPSGDDRFVLVGNPTSNPAVKQMLGERWPDVSDQGIVLRSVQADGRDGIVVGGGSPVATLWAVYELGYRFGVRYLLREDIFPETPPALELDGIDVRLEPQLRRRSWRTINDFAIGPESWSLADHRRLLRQLAKLKFNHLLLSMYPWQPFVHYELNGIKKQTGMLWYGERYPIPRDAPGRTGLGGVDEFQNAEFAGATNYDQMLAAGTRLASGIVDEAHRLGMQVGVAISPLEFPREFAAILPGAVVGPGINRLVVTPGKDQRIEDPTLSALVAAKIRAYLDTYPTIDALYLTLPEFPLWDAQVRDAWQTLTVGIESPPKLEDLINAARQRTLVAAGSRGVQSLQGNIVALAFLKRLLADANLLTRPDGRQVELVITAVDPELFPWIDQLLPAGAGTLNFIDYTPSRVNQHSEYLGRLPADKVPSSLIMTLADDNVGVLSQSWTRHLEPVVGELHDRHWRGFSTRYWLLAELDPSVHYLSRAAWDATVTARGAHDELFNAVTGKQSISDRLWLAFGHIERAGELIDEHDLGFAFPVQGMLMKHYQPQPEPEWWSEVRDEYTQAMEELYRSHGAVDARSRQLLFYWAKRSEYVLAYLKCLQSLRQAAISKAHGDQDAAAEQLGTAVEQLYDAIDSLGDVAQDPSDRGLIAVLNAYAYRPLVAEYERLTGQ